MRQASQPSEPNRQTTLRCHSGRRFCFCICAPKSQILSNPPQLSWCCLDRLSPQVQCSARVNPFVKTCPEDNYRPGSRFISAAWNRWRGLPLDDVLGGIQGGVDPSTPRTLVAVVRRRKLELERLPIASEDAVHEHAFRRQLDAERYAVRVFAPVWLV